MTQVIVSRLALSKGFRLRCHSHPCLKEITPSTASWKSAYSFLNQGSCRRGLTTSVVKKYPRRTDVLGSPRWINRQSEKSDSKENSDEEAQEEDTEETPKRRDKSESPGSEVRLSEDEGGRASSSSSPASSSGEHDGNSGEGPSSSSSSPPPHRESAPPTSAISRQNVPENYPQVLALPIARRPLFPGFYKAVVIKNPAVVAAIKEMMKRGQPYLGAFLLKDEHTDSDIITDINSVHHVGVFAQITSIFTASGAVSKEDDGKEEGLTAVLYPHRRIKLTSLISRADSTTTATVQRLDEASEGAPLTPPASPLTSEIELPTSGEGSPSPSMQAGKLLQSVYNSIPGD